MPEGGEGGEVPSGGVGRDMVVSVDDSDVHFAWEELDPRIDPGTGEWKASA